MKKLFIFLLIAIPLILYAQGFNSAHSPERNWFSYKNTSNFNQNRTNNNYIDQNSYVGLQNSMKFSGIGGYGNSVSSAGDLNNDGYDDLIVGFSGFGLSKVFIYFGGSIIDTVADLYLTGIRPTFGGSVSSAGDVNNDGYDDVIIGESGKAYIFYGGSPMDNIADVIFTGESSNYANSVSSAGDIKIYISKHFH